MNYKSYLNDNWDIITILIIYLVLAIFSLQFFQYKIAGDEISYIDVAHAYAIGHLGNAINGYWSPLFSWLMVPFIFLLGFKPLIGVYISKIITIIIGFFIILSIRRLSHTFNLDKSVERGLLFAMIPSILFFALLYNTPDLLLVLLLILYLSILFDSEYSNKLIYGVYCGIVGGAAYLTKSYAFPFFLFHFLLFNLIFYFKSNLNIEKKNILKNLILGLSIFFVISGLWAGIISEKYGELTISTSGAYNQALVGPEYKDNIMDTGISPIYYVGLIKPPNTDSISIGDDYTYLKLNQWSPFNSWKNMKYELNLIGANILYTFNILESFMSSAFIILILITYLIFRSKLDKLSKNILKYLLLTMLIYMGGYCLITPEWRYLWFIFVLLMFSGFYILDRLYKSKTINLTMRNIFLVFFIFSLIFQPTIQAVHFANQHDNSYNLSNILRQSYGIHGNLASNKYLQMDTISYYLNAKYYGVNRKTNSSLELANELKDNNIDFYFLWDTDKDLNLSSYHEITDGKIAGLKIYSKIN
jgi:hypothetical protein